MFKMSFFLLVLQHTTAHSILSNNKIDFIHAMIMKSVRISTTPLPPPPWVAPH